MTHLPSVNSYPLLENSTWGWPISTTNFSLPILNQTQIENREEKITELKNRISPLERKKQSIERVALQIQRSFLEIYKISDRLMGKLVAENPSQKEILLLAEKREIVLDRLKNWLLYIAQENLSVDQLTQEFSHKLEEDSKAMQSFFHKQGFWLGFDRSSHAYEVFEEISFTHFLCNMNRELTLPILKRIALCENQKTRNIYLLDLTIGQFISDELRIITDKIDPLKKEIKLERGRMEIKKKNPLKIGVQGIKPTIENQERERANIQKTAWEIQKLLKEGSFISTGLMYHFLYHPPHSHFHDDSPPLSYSHSHIQSHMHSLERILLYDPIHALLEKRISFGNSLLTQIEKLPRETEEKEAVRQLLGKIFGYSEAGKQLSPEESAGSSIDFLHNNTASDENRRTTLLHQLSSEIEKISNKKIDSINKKINDLKERLELPQIPEPEPLKLTASIKVLSTTALIGYGLGGVAGLSMVTAIVGCVFWLRMKSQAPQNRNPENQQYLLPRFSLQTPQESME